jgi:hypothetical protein
VEKVTEDKSYEVPRLALCANPCNKPAKGGLCQCTVDPQLNGSRRKVSVAHLNESGDKVMADGCIRAGVIYTGCYCVYAIPFVAPNGYGPKMLPFYKQT